MTLAEKIGQMTQIEVSRVVGNCTNGPGPLNQTCAQSVLGDAAVGSILSGGGSPPTENILGATYDPALEQATQASAGKAALATDVRWGFGPIADVDRDTTWGRYGEPFGEDPTLDATMEAAGVRGLQASGQVGATVKHFAGYGGASNGLDRTDVDMSIRWLQDDELPSYQGGLDAGGETVMVDSGAVNGVPATSSHYLLTTILRDRMHFDGVVVSDWNDIAALQTKYHIAADYEHAAAIAINAGVDMAMEPFNPVAFETAVNQAVTDHLIRPSRIDESAGRVLALKFRTGVFDHPLVDASVANQTVGMDADLARQAAESTVVLQNRGNVLPLPTTAHVTVTGPNDKRDPSLPADQQAMVSALVATGKPVVVVVVDDHPRPWARWSRPSAAA